MAQPVTRNDSSSCFRFHKSYKASQLSGTTMIGSESYIVTNTRERFVQVVIHICKQYLLLWLVLGVRTFCHFREIPDIHMLLVTRHNSNQKDPDKEV